MGEGKAGAAVALTDVTIAFRLADGGTYQAVERATLNVADGEFVAIVGPTGCGKTTLLNVAAGLFPPTTGRVGIFGSPLDGLNRQSGYLFQSEALFPWKTAIENVAIGLEIAGTAKAGARERHGPVADDARSRARRHDDHAIGQRDRFFEIVRDEHHRLAVRAPQVEQQVAHDLARLRIERAERLVH